MDNVNLRSLTEKVIEVAREAGAFIKSERKKFNRECVEEKNSHDYVSYVDKHSEQFIVDRLKSLLPEAGFIAEEGTLGYDDQHYCWVIDPLDGTTNFIHNNAPYCVSIALRNPDEILIGVVYEICRDECYWTCKGDKSYLNGEPIGVSSVSNADSSMFIIGLPYNAKAYKPMVMGLINDLYGNVSSLRVIGAAAVELCYVAAGRFEGRIEAELKPWDVAAGALILINAGGTVTDFSGGNGFYSGSQVLASNTHMHQMLLNKLNSINSRIQGY